MDGWNTGKYLLTKDVEVSKIVRIFYEKMSIW